jgi:hypothetical protein
MLKFLAASDFLAGRFVLPGAYSQELTLGDIEAKDGKLVGKLTLWARVSRCSVRSAVVQIVTSGAEFTVEGEGSCWKYRLVGNRGKEHKFEGTLTTDNGNASTFFLD